MSAGPPGWKFWPWGAELVEIPPVMARLALRFLSCLLLWSAVVQADTVFDRPVPEGGGPTEIRCAIGLLDLDEINDAGQNFTANTYMRFSWNEIVFDHDKWGARRYPLFAYADGTGRVRNVTSAWESGVDGNGQSLPDEAYPDGQMADAAIEKLREFADDGTRFCLAVGFHKPHLPFNAPKAYFDLYNPATLPDPSPVAAPTGANSATTTNSGEINAYSNQNDRAQLRHAYFACVSYVDAQVGKVLAELDTLGLADNTVVVLWGDHGWCLDDYGLIGKHKVLERAVESR